MDMFVVAGNGYITTSVLKEILKELDDKMSPEDLDSIIEEIDSDGSGTVDFDGKDFDKDLSTSRCCASVTHISPIFNLHCHPVFKH